SSMQFVHSMFAIQSLPEMPVPSSTLNSMSSSYWGREYPLQSRVSLCRMKWIGGFNIPCLPGRDSQSSPLVAVEHKDGGAHHPRPCANGNPSVGSWGFDLKEERLL